MLLSTGSFFNAGGGSATPGPTYPLDGLSPTGAWSVSRALLSAYGGSFYSDVSGAITSLLDQSGASRNLTDGAVATRRPALSTAGPNSRACADFDGTSDFLISAAGDPLSDFIAAGAGFVVIGCIIDAFTLNNANSYANDLLIGDQSQFMGIYLRNTAGGTGYAYNWDGNADNPSATLTTATPYVLSWRHEGGTVYFGINGTEVSAASGNTSTLTGSLNIAGRGGQFFNGKVFEAAAFSTVPGSGDRTAIIADMMDWIGA